MASRPYVQPGSGERQLVFALLPTHLTSPSVCPPKNMSSHGYEYVAVDPCPVAFPQLWKAEEKAATEQRQLEELRKQYAAEREAEELREVAIAGGHLKCADTA